MRAATKTLALGALALESKRRAGSGGGLDKTEASEARGCLRRGRSVRYGRLGHGRLGGHDGPLRPLACAVGVYRANLDLNNVPRHIAVDEVDMFVGYLGGGSHKDVLETTHAHYAHTH